MEFYTHLSLKEREEIQLMKSQGISLRQIAITLGRNVSSISRELRRNVADSGHYWPDTAFESYKKRRRHECRIDRYEDLRTFVTETLTYHFWTPEQIAGYLKYRQDKLPYVSHETIYKWLYEESQKILKLFQFLPRHKARRGQRASKAKDKVRIKDRVSIHERPKEIDKNKTFGHWEADLMSCQKNTQFILVLRERLTMLVKSVRLPNKTANETCKAIEQLLKDLPVKARASITFDNGTEFAFHSKLKEKLNTIQTYFCDPYAPWQKGRVENSNGRLRRDFSRKVNLKKMDQEDFDESIENYNSTPRKGLKWLTPEEVFQKNINRVALQT